MYCTAAAAGLGSAVQPVAAAATVTAANPSLAAAATTVAVGAPLAGAGAITSADPELVAWPSCCASARCCPTAGCSRVARWSERCPAWPTACVRMTPAANSCSPAIRHRRRRASRCMRRLCQHNIFKPYCANVLWYGLLVITLDQLPCHAVLELF